MEDVGWKYYLRLMLNILVPVTGRILSYVIGPKVLKFFMLFVIGWIIATVANPLVRFLERRIKLVRKHSSIVIVVTALALVIGLIYLVPSRSLVLLHGFMKNFPALYEGIEGGVVRSMEQIEHLFRFLPDNIQQIWAGIGSNLGSYMGKAVEKLASPTVEAAGSVVRSIPAVLVYPAVTILSAYFFIVDRDRILAMIKTHTLIWAQRYTRHLRGELLRLIGGYSMAQFKIMVVVWLTLTVGFLMLGVGYAPLWAFLIASLDFLPVFGTGTALIPWGLTKLLGGKHAFAVGFLLIYVLAQAIRQLIQPRLVGDSMGLNPLLTLLPLYLDSKVKGIAGMTLAVPTGLLFVGSYEYKAFQGIKDSLDALIKGIGAFRRKE